jgi:hypothetical protein
MTIVSLTPKKRKEKMILPKKFLMKTNLKENI